MKRIQTVFLSLALLCALLLSSCEGILPSTASVSYDLDDLPAYSGEPYVAVNNNEPFFTQEDMITNSYETYSELDALGRCGVAWANVGVDLMPTEDRGSIGQVKPSGWHTVKYDVVDGKYLYNRCHLIGFQLTGENANEKNLITGTRYLNVDGMLPFEDLVTDYVKETENHVLYRVTPIFQEDELVARGVLMEGLSVEDDGVGQCPARSGHRLRHRRQLAGGGGYPAPGDHRRRRGYRLCDQHQLREVPSAHLLRRGGHVAGQPAGLRG